MKAKGLNGVKCTKKTLQKGDFGLFDTSAGSAYYSIVRKNGKRRI
jgi:hypothetical protein